MIHTILLFAIAFVLVVLVASAFGALVAIMDITLQSMEDKAAQDRRRPPNA